MKSSVQIVNNSYSKHQGEYQSATLYNRHTEGPVSAISLIQHIVLLATVSSTSVDPALLMSLAVGLDMSGFASLGHVPPVSYQLTKILQSSAPGNHSTAKPPQVPVRTTAKAPRDSRRDTGAPEHSTRRQVSQKCQSLAGLSRIRLAV